MPRVIRPTLFTVLAAIMVVGCATPTPIQSTAAPTQPAPTPTQPEPTQPAPTQTATPGIAGDQVVIPVNTGVSTDTLNATITGNGEVAIILANSLDNTPLRWAPLVDALSQNENLRMVTFAYRGDEDGHITDTIAVFEYLQAEGIDQIICVGAGPGSTACAGLKTEPEIIGMALFASIIPAIEADFPKLFLTAEADPYGLTGPTERAYEQSAEPKMLKVYAASRHGPGLFTADVGPQVLADVKGFINGIVSGQ